MPISPDPEHYQIGTSILLVGVFTTARTLGEILVGQNSLYVQDASGYANADKLLIEEAGTIFGDLVATILAINGNVITLDKVAGTTAHTTKVGKLFAPASVVAKVRLPDQTLSTPSVSTASLGFYKATYKAVQVGPHFYRFSDTDSGVEAAEEEMFVVDVEYV